MLIPLASWLVQRLAWLHPIRTVLLRGRFTVIMSFTMDLDEKSASRVGFLNT